MSTLRPQTEIGLNAAIVAVTEETPRILTVRAEAMPPMEHPESLGNWAESHYALPSGPFEAATHRTLDLGLRRWVEEQAGLTLGYVEQLYTFADRHRDPRELAGGPRIVTIGYLAAVKPDATLIAEGRQVKQGRRAGFYEISVSTEEGTPVATLHCVAHRVAS